MKNNYLLLLLTFVCLNITVRAQTWQWATKAGGVENDYANGIDVDLSGNSYITGTFYDSATFGLTTLTSPGIWSVYIAKYDAYGNLVWAKTAAQGSLLSVRGIYLDPTGNISITGEYSGTITCGTSTPVSLSSSGSYDVYVAQYNSAGDLDWTKSFGGPGIDYVGALSKDNNGNVFLTGEFHLTAFQYSSSKLFIAKYDSKGNNSWLRTELDYGFSHFGNSIKTDAVGNSYITGEFFNTIKFNITDSIDAGNKESNIFIAKFDSSGNILWGQKAGAGSGYCGSKAIDIDAGGNSFITGYYHGTISLGSYNITSTSGLGYDVFVAKCDTIGNFVWVNQSNGAGSSNAISLDKSGNIFVSGTYDKPIHFGSYTLTNSGSTDVFIAELNSSGNFIWATSCGGVQSDFVNDIKVNPNGIYITGYFTDIIHFGTSFSLTNYSTTKPDIFVAKLKTLTRIEESSNNDIFALYPNPTKGVFTILLPSDPAEITVTNLLGQLIIKTVATAKTMDLQLDNNGVYLVFIKTIQGTVAKKLIVNR